MTDPTPELCPFCGWAPKFPKYPGGTTLQVACANISCGRNRGRHDFWYSLDQWNHRPGEESLRAAVARAEARAKKAEARADAAETDLSALRSLINSLDAERKALCTLVADAAEALAAVPDADAVRVLLMKKLWGDR